MIICIRSTERFDLNHDERAGVANIERRADGALTDWETGQDCVSFVDDMLALSNDEFDAHCSTLSFD